MIQQGLRQMFSGMLKYCGELLLTLYKIGIAQLQGTFGRGTPPRHQRHSFCTASGSLLYLKYSTACVPQSISILRTYYTQFTSIQRLGFSIDGVEFTLYVQRDGKELQALACAYANLCRCCGRRQVHYVTLKHIS